MTWTNAFDAGTCTVTVSYFDGSPSPVVFSSVMAKGGSASFNMPVSGALMSVAVDANGVVTLSSETAMLDPKGFELDVINADTATNPVRVSNASFAGNVTTALGCINDSGNSAGVDFLNFITLSPATPNPMDLTSLTGTKAVVGVFAYGSAGSFVSPTLIQFTPEINIGAQPVTTSYNCSCDSPDFPTKTLGQLRTMMMTRLGFAAMMVPTPGMVPLLDSFLIEAQELLYRRYKVFQCERWFTWAMSEGTRFYDLSANDDAVNGLLAAPVMSAPATATTGGTLAAGSYGYVVTALNVNGETTPSAESLITTTGSTSTSTISWAAVTGATGYKVYGRTAGSETLLATLGAVSTWTDTGAAVPGSDLPPTENTTPLCDKTLDPRMVTWVGISQDAMNWRPLQCGINPVRYTSLIYAIPDSYEIRQCIEVWPAPPDNTWSLRIKGYFGIQQFENDNDKTTIDYRAVFLLALANAKAHYGQGDANNIAAQLATFMGDLVAGTHMTRRYVPGQIDRYPAVPPKMV